MKSTELRIGNYINTLTKDTHSRVVFSLGGMEGTHTLINSYREKLIKPIPLTEEWLIDFGFEMYDYTVDENSDIGTKDDYYKSYKISDNIKDLIVNINPTSIEFCVKWDWSEEGILTELKYVHQLQNLYFALCGEELKLKS
jgi:hypothetical protein